MEHYKSTLATAAIAAFGLVAAAHILHPGNYERTTRPVRHAAVVSAVAWVDPPAIQPVAEAKADKVPVAWTSAVAPPQTAEAAPPPVEVAPERRRKASAAHRRKVAQRPAHLREATLNKPADAAPASASQAQSRRIDPIGDIIRGLGLGSDS